MLILLLNDREKYAINEWWHSFLVQEMVGHEEIGLGNNRLNYPIGRQESGPHSWAP